MRSLFICVTQFQVLAALSFMKAPENEGKVVDLVLVPPIAQETRWLTWLKAVGCFARIYRLASAYTKLIEKRDVLHPKKIPGLLLRLSRLSFRFRKEEKSFDASFISYSISEY